MISRLRGFLNAPLSNQVLLLRNFYRRLLTTVFYAPMFKSMGRGCVIHKPMLIANADCISIGDRVLIRDGVRMEAIRDPFGRTPSLSIGADTNIEQDVHIICHSRIVIGKQVSITGRCAIVDTTHPFNNFAAGKIGSQIANDDSFVEIGDGAFLGYGAVILPNVRIGQRAVIGANSVVNSDIPDYAVAAGSPARVLRIYHRENESAGRN